MKFEISSPVGYAYYGYFIDPYRDSLILLLHIGAHMISTCMLGSSGDIEANPLQISMYTYIAIASMINLYSP